MTSEYGEFSRVTKGGLGTKMILTEDIKKMKYLIPTFIPKKIMKNDIPKPKMTFI